MQILNGLIQKIQSDLENVHHFWQRFWTKTKMMNIYEGHFGFIEKDFSKP